ncbi:NACHT domain-containing protein [Cellulosimicrobium funkei]|uniref:hypothetical protein n=1 Tax=Cellulosimicrobium funkei TaxID=264251 RepID=UPI0036A70A90
MLTSDQSGGGVLRAELVDEAARFLANVVEGTAECRAAAIEFVDFCKGRAWVLSDAGTTAEGDELYKFTHRTFMEYFAAYELTRKADGPEALAKTLIPRVARGEWDVVAQLAVQIMDKSSAAGAERVLRRCLMDKRKRTPQGRDNIHGFIWRCLSFVRVSESLTRDLIAKSIDSSLRHTASTHGYAEPSIVYAMMAMPEALGSVSRLLADELTARLDSEDPEVRLESAAVLGSWAEQAPGTDFPDQTVVWWREWLKALVLGADSPVLGRETDMLILHGLFTRRLMDLDAFAVACAARNVRLGDYLFKDTLGLPYRYLLVSWGTMLLSATFRVLGDPESKSSPYVLELETLAKHFPPTVEVPFASRQKGLPFFLSVHDESLRPILNSGEARWGACILYMMASETMSAMRGWEDHAATLVREFAHAREGDPSSREVALGFLQSDGAEREMLTRWIAGEISLTSDKLK